MKILAVALLCLFSASSAFANAQTNKNALSLIKKIEWKQKRIKNELRVNQSLIKVLQPDLIRQGDAYSLYFQSNTEVTGTNSLIDLEIDGSPVAVEQPATGLFIYHSSGETEVKTHNAVAKLSIEDAAEAKSLRDAITQLDVEILALQDQIDEMEPGEAQDALILERDEKVGIKNQLIAALAAIKTPIGEEAFTFRIVAAAGNNPDFFRILSVSPSFGAVEGGTELTITGQRFPTGMEAILGGVTLPVTFVSSTEVKITTPDFTSAGGVGIKSLELKKAGATPQDPVKNATRSNVFYAANITVPVGNIKPVAVAGASQSVNVGTEVTMNGSGSYDSNSGTTLTYSWKAISVPAGSGINTGVEHSSAQSFNFTPSRPGSYVWELTVNDGEFDSEASLTVVTANPPANSAPVPTASAISVGLSGSTTRQVTHGDVDDYQAHSYRVIKESAFGTASVSSTGLVSFTAGSSAGSDSIEILVMDNGNPPLSGVVSIPVSVVTSTIVVNDPYNYNTARDGFITVTLGADTLSTTAPGGIRSVVWDFGDGTSGASPYPYTNNGSVEHDYLVAGTYTAVATVTDAYGNTGSKSYTFSTGTSAMPVPHLVSSVYSGAAPLTVSFDATGSTDDVGIGQYRFRWADGTAETKNNTGLATHTFNNEGTFRVQLRTRDADQNVSFAYVDIYVGSSPLPEKSRPVPQMNITSKEVLVSAAHSFSAASSFDPNASGSITDYRWNFGDYSTCNGGHATPGCVDTGSSVTYTYPAANSYWVNLEVEGALGGVSTLTKQVLAVNSGHAPRAMPGRDKVEGVAPLTVNVDGSTSFDYDGAISSHQWTFGDPGCTVGCSASSATGSYTYTNPGNYWVNLTVTDNDGNVHSNGYSAFVYPSAKVKAQVEKSIKAVKAKRAETKEVDFERERQKNLYAELCSKGSGVACYNAGRMYEEDGDTYAAGNFYAMACSLGYEAACSR